MDLTFNEERSAELDSRFQYVLVDEYQDTNQAQYVIANRLCLNYRNICTVGDPDQCVAPGTLISTPSGPRLVEQIREGDEVLSATGMGRIAPKLVNKVMCNPHRGKLLRITLENGIAVRATPNHVCFTRLTPQQKMNHQQFTAVDGADWANRKWHLPPSYTFFT